MSATVKQQNMASVSAQGAKKYTETEQLNCCREGLSWT